MKLFNKTAKKVTDENTAVGTSPATYNKHPFSALGGYIPLQRPETELYKTIREAIPLIDAAISKLVRLTGTFQVKCGSKGTEEQLGRFLKTVKVNGTGVGISSFINTYFDQLLTFGTAVGEMLIDPDTLDFAALYNADLNDIELKQGENPLDVFVCRRAVWSSKADALPNQHLILTSVLNPEPGGVYGTSVLKGLPFVSTILLKIFNTIGTNWERIGNVRFAVTYKPPENSGDRAYTRERANQIAKEWSSAMRDTTHVSDFVSVGDVSIKVIGADNQILDSDVPVRHMLEQIIAKLGIPPYLLGLSWSSTERMSSNQADILTSEIDYYRNTLTPCIEKICRLWLRLNGYSDDIEIIWDNVNLLDETELANARLTNAQALKLEQEINAAQS